LAKQVQIKKSEIPNGWSLEAADFINRLLQRQPRTRLGYKGGVAELKEHPWLKRYTWRKLLAQEIASPLTPSSNSYESSDDE
jgi:serine/threonine protein kinase